jgi:MoaA/NifB/PqqE/SkfB family radical SAM enzyme
MRWTDLRTGFTCNHACRFCDQAELRASWGEADREAVERAIDALPHREGLVLAGGEVTLRADLLGLVALARERGFARIALQTNGSVLASPSAAPGLRAAGITDVVLALHAPTAAVHDWLTAREGSFKRVVAAARRCVGAGITLRVHTVLTRTGGPLLPETVGLAARLGARSLRAIVGREAGAAVAEARMLLPRWERLVEPIELAHERARADGVEFEVVGLPPCVSPSLRAVLGDRRDTPSVERVSALPTPPNPEAIYPPCCDACTLRPICPGVHAAYVARWGTDELRPAGPQPAPPDHRHVHLSPTDTSRTLRQALVRWQGAGVRRVTFHGSRPEPELQGLFRECERLGMVADVAG